MNNYMKTIISGLKQWVSSQKSDWNQNDSSAANFIKNRPFYSEEKEKVLFSGNVETVDDSGFYRTTLSYVPCEIGQEYKVIFAGTAYICKAFNNVNVWSGQAVLLGNLGMLNAATGLEAEDTGEPFFFINLPEEETAIYTQTAGAYDVSISGIFEEVHQIDKKYIPMPDLADVAHTGDYYDLQNTPYIPWDAVRYAGSQSLTDGNKQLARNNIGAASQSDLNSLQSKDYLIRFKTEGRAISGIIKDATTDTAKSRTYKDEGYYFSPYENISVPLYATSSGLFYSLNGKDWLSPVASSTDFDFTQSFSCVTSLYAVVSNSDILYKKSGYINDSVWTKITLPASQGWSKTTVNSSRAILIADNSNIGAYSADGGTTWSSITLPEAAVWVDLQSYWDTKEAKVIFCALTNSKIFITKDNGQNWEAVNLTITPKTLFLDNKVFIAAGGKKIAYSIDKGITWNESVVEDDYGLNFLQLGWLNDTSLFAYGYKQATGSNYIYRSDNLGKTWYKLSYLPALAKENSIVQNVYGYKTGFIETNRDSERKPIWFSNNGIDWVDELVLLKDEVKMSLHEGILSMIPANPLDSTLSLEGAPADAKVTGDAIAALKTPANTTEAGLMSAADKTKVDNIATNLVNGTGTKSLKGAGANYASGENAVALGSAATALGADAVALGSSTTALGNYSYAEGNYTLASGDYSHAEGDYTIAASANQHVQGKYNIEDSANKYAHIVGNGESDLARSNAHTLDWNGNAWFAGNIYVGGTGQDSAAAVKVAIVPFPTEADEGKILRVVNGAPTWVALSSAEEASF